jgi:alkylation response protein AidB-like acyl-CoA dehydrogenase
LQGSTAATQRVGQGGNICRIEAGSGTQNGNVAKITTIVLEANNMNDVTLQESAIEAFRDSARDLLSRGNTTVRVRQLRGSDTGFDRSAWQEIANAGWLGVLVSEQDGGLGLGLREMSAIAEEIGQRLLPEPLIAVGVQFAAVVSGAPQSALRSVLLEQLVGGALVAGVAWQETLGQLQAQHTLATTAQAQGDTLLLNGVKKFVTPAQGADGWVVLAKLAEQPVLVWVPADTQGVSHTDQRAVDGAMLCTLTLQNVQVPKTHLLMMGTEVLAVVDRANDAARVIQAAEMLGVMRRALSVTAISKLSCRRPAWQMC